MPFGGYGRRVWQPHSWEARTSGRTRKCEDHSCPFRCAPFGLTFWISHRELQDDRHFASVRLTEDMGSRPPFSSTISLGRWRKSRYRRPASAFCRWQGL